MASGSRTRSATWLRHSAMSHRRCKRSSHSADRIRTKGDPAAELILLPEGGELKADHIAPVMKAFARIKRRRTIIDDTRTKLEHSRLGAKSKAQLEAQIDRLRKAIGRGAGVASYPSFARRRHRHRAPPRG